MINRVKLDDSYTAIHEAAHAVVGLLLGSPLESVTIKSDDETGSAGHTIHWPGSPYSDRGGYDWNLMVRAITCYAGHAATRHFGYDEDYVEAACEKDYRDAAFAIDSIAGGHEDRVEELQNAALATARMMVGLSWNEIEVVADVLVTQRNLSGSEVEEVLTDLTL